MSDGLTIYFASTGHQSLGGYDLYVTRYNLASDSYLTPNQLNMPFNSPFNDYMMVIDEEKGVGWFASDRFQPDGLVCVYTFLPNPQITLLESDDEAYIYRRARITSIADSWREGVEYGTFREAAQLSDNREEENTVEFEFIINDEKVYHRLDDFTFSNARSLYSQAIGLTKQLEVLTNELKEKKRVCAKGGELTVHSSHQCLNLKKKVKSCTDKLRELKNGARNEEIKKSNQINRLDMTFELMIVVALIWWASPVVCLQRYFCCRGISVAGIAGAIFLIGGLS